MLGLGIDIGTTSISFVILDSVSGDVIHKLLVNNTYQVGTANVWEKLQDPNQIVCLIQEKLKELVVQYPQIECIGVTGQMHGILYVDQEGNAVSPLYTWQDERGNQSFDRDNTYVEWALKETGYKIATGYGLLTHYYNTRNNLVDQKAASLCTIGDYVVMQLTHLKKPLLHASNAASLGLYCISESGFDFNAARKLGLSVELLPDTTSDICCAGQTDEGIDVSVAIGDNQASFIGSVNDMEKCILVNVGTGSQISIVSGRPVKGSEIEMRPLVSESSLVVGASLCGGRAFAMLKNFFEQVLKMFEIEQISNTYQKMEKIIENCAVEQDLMFSTKFCGTRGDAKQRAAITNLGLDNFTPQHFIVGVLNGIADELHGMYNLMNEGCLSRKEILIGSGNAIRKTAFLQRVFEHKFNMKLKIPKHEEEAAYGTTLVAFVAKGVFSDLCEAQQIISYN